MNTRIVIVANGRLYKKIIEDITKDDFVIGVDRAAYWLISQGVIPTVAIGDFDSTKEKELRVIRRAVKEVKIYPAEKDYTDTELALEYALGQKPSSIVLYGGSGTRLDHTLSVIHLLQRGVRQRVPIVFRDETNEVQIFHRCRTILDRKGEHKYISILPITNIATISLSGLKYPLHRKNITFDMTLGISNEFTSKQATITVHKGEILVIQSSD
ncbi:thiamine diphosphokinase [Candidatus Gottesmanbacteria bacterium RBG_13_45_10]|uniref:Thiamine diphosphokinase n=1 Tax=Candidatus Gottesmanbacteria bacterium RBG_13_45_10 TaxID=1798370 RepID=A0A1F5ZHB4_9BACT|nr:MAG: thiamine diphosphokinase [Candidatus Gottesmanbacteria bacterium RBG_13_45_10]